MDRLFKDGFLPGALLSFWVLVHPQDIILSVSIFLLFVLSELNAFFNSPKYIIKVYTKNLADSRTRFFAQKVLISACKKAKTAVPVLHAFRPQNSGDIIAATAGTTSPVIVCSNSILKLPRDQIEGVFLHELGHIYHNHLIKTLFLSVSTLILAFGFLFEASHYLPIYLTLVLSLFLFSIRPLLELVYQHYCEYQADKFSYRYNSKGIIDFLTEYGSKENNWFNVHPSAEKRISALLKIN